MIFHIFSSPGRGHGNFRIIMITQKFIDREEKLEVLRRRSGGLKDREEYYGLMARDLEGKGALRGGGYPPVWDLGDFGGFAPPRVRCFYL